MKSKFLSSQVPHFEIPMPDPALCQGCADCVHACPQKAIRLDRM